MCKKDTEIIKMWINLRISTPIFGFEQAAAERMAVNYWNELLKENRKRKYIKIPGAYWDEKLNSWNREAYYKLKNYFTREIIKILTKK